MAEYTVKLEDFAAHIGRKLKAMAESVPPALVQTAIQSVPHIQDNIPEAFGELKQSTIAHPSKDGASVSVTAPHAAAVEVGSRPHTPPLEPLIRWVKLRGMQGITKRGKIRAIGRLPKSGLSVRRINRLQARQVATTLKGMEQGGALDINAPEIIARAIQHAISISGTKPYHYMRRSIPKIVNILVEQIREGMNAAIQR